MKKSIMSFILGMSIMLTPPVFAIEEMSSDVMKKTTGQASVSVRVDNVIIEDVSLSMLYIDDDGDSGTPEDAGAIRIRYTHNYQTIRAIFDYTDRGGYLRREYGTIMRRDIGVGGAEEWAGISAGGEKKPTEQTMTVTKKLKRQSYMEACNSRTDGLREAKEIYNSLRSLGLDYKGDEASNIDILMNATGMGQYEANLAYSVASDYANITSQADADKLATKMAFRNTNISGLEMTLPTLEYYTDHATVSYSIEAEGSWNHGAELIKMSRTGGSMAILSGNVEVSSNRAIRP